MHMTDRLNITSSFNMQILKILPFVLLLSHQIARGGTWLYFLIQLSVTFVYKADLHLVVCTHLMTSSSSFFSTADVALESSLGTRRACPDESVNYTCTVTEGTNLTWTAEPRFPSDSLIVYSSLESTLRFIFTTSLNGTVVQCTGTHATTNSTLYIAGTLFVALLSCLSTRGEEYYLSPKYIILDQMSSYVAICIFTSV